jgi:uncharacterized protein (DUF1800 family)
MDSLNSCNLAHLEPYTPDASKPWNIQRVRHISRRLGFGLNSYDEKTALGLDPQTFIDEWIDEAVSLPNSPAPEWGYWSRSDYSNYNDQRFPHIKEWRIQTFRDILTKNLQAKMTLFWHNHFVTEVEDYSAPSWLFQYYNLLQTHAFGNFKEFTKAIGKNEAMLVYLNGSQNTKNNPNENYARELFELFTLGVNNGYTQDDIVEASRALTGYTSISDLGGTITFNPNKFDNTEKVIFGVTANFDHDSLIEHLFEVRKPQIAQHIVKKIYQFFVGPVLPAQEIIDELADLFIVENWEIEPVLRLLFKSGHFMDDAAISTIIKSPLDYVFTFLKECNFQLTDDQAHVVGGFAAQLGQEYYNPIDVAGWQGNQQWINGSTLTGRWQGGEYIMWAAWQMDEELLRNIALDSSESIDDVDQIARDIVNRFVSRPLFTESDYELAVQVFKGDVPGNYFQDRIWNINWNSVPYQVILLLRHIFRMPEFQLY